MKAFESLERAFEHLEEYSNATLEDIQTSSPIIESPPPPSRHSNTCSSDSLF